MNAHRDATSRPRQHQQISALEQSPREDSAPDRARARKNEFRLQARYHQFKFIHAYIYLKQNSAFGVVNYSARYWEWLIVWLQPSRAICCDWIFATTSTLSRAMTVATTTWRCATAPTDTPPWSAPTAATSSRPCSRLRTGIYASNLFVHPNRNRPR